ncbi:hypothetical protein UlMin_009242 [Ulmus minor]
MASPANSPITLLLVLSTLLLFATAAPPPSSPPHECTDELVMFSPCLEFVSAPPNNLSDRASSNCCQAFSSAFNSGSGICLCFLIREPLILGFPLNDTRLRSLPSVCSGRNESLDSICAGFQALPPLHSSSISGIGNASNSGSNNETSPSTSTAPPLPGRNNPSTQTQSSLPPAHKKKPPMPPSFPAEQPVSATTDQDQPDNSTVFFTVGMTMLLLAIFFPR